jgi:hypothetical protein
MDHLCHKNTIIFDVAAVLLTVQDILPFIW